MKRPRTTITTLLVVALAAALTACGGKTSGPTQVTTQFIEALAGRNRGTACKLLSTGAREWGTYILDAAREDLPTGGELTSTLLEEIGNTARVHVEFDMTPSRRSNAPAASPPTT